MTRVILFLMTFALSLGQLMAAPAAGQAAAQELAREIFKAFQSGKMSERKPGLAADVKTLEKAVEAHPDDPVILFGLALCYASQENRPAALSAYAKAIESLEAALVSTPRMIVALSQLGEAYLKAGDLDKARANIDKAAAINPSFPHVLYYRGLVLEKMGNPAMAEKSFQDAYANGKKRLRDDGEDYYLMYLVCLKQSKPEEAKGYKAEAEKLLFTYEAPWIK